MSTSKPDAELRTTTDGCWANMHAVRTRLRHLAGNLPTLPEVARHEAGHIVAAWAMGVPLVFASARPLRRRGREFLGMTDRDESVPWSSAEDLVRCLAGRVEDERQGRFDPVEIIEGRDECGAIVSALDVAHGDPARAVSSLLAGELIARRLLEEHRGVVDAVAIELERRDLHADDFAAILGPLPEPWARRDYAPGPVRRDVRIRAVWECIPALLHGRRHALAFVDGRLLAREEMALAWLDSRGDMVAAPVSVVRSGVGDPEVIARRQTAA